MTNVSTLLDQALNPELVAKKQEVSAATIEKQLDYSSIATARATGKGSKGLTGIDWDLRNLSPSQLEFKYGQQGVQLMGNIATGSRQNVRDAQVASQRTFDQAAWDSTSGVASGLVAGLGSVGAVGLGLVNEDAGTWASDRVNAFTGWVESGQSDGINAVRDLQRRESALDTQDNAAQMRQEIAEGSNDTLAGMRRWGRDVVDTVSNSTDPAMFVQGTSEAVGSLLAGGPIAKGLKAIGKTALATVGARLSPNAAIGLGAAGGKAAWPAAIAGLEGGGAYTGTVGEIMGMQHEELMQNSPHYPALIESGLAPEQAKIRIANDGGLRAAAIQGTIGALSAGLSRWAETPFKVPTVRSGLQNVFINEPLEEAIQGTTGQLAQNEAIQTYADRTKNLSEGVGEQTATGALYGMGAAGAVQGPNLAMRSAIDGTQSVYQGTKAAVKKAIGSGENLQQIVADRADNILKAVEEKSSAGRVAQTENAQNVVNSLDTDGEAISGAIAATDAPQEQKTAAQDFVGNLKAAMRFDPNEIEIPDGLTPSDELVTNVGNAKNRIEAVYAVAAEIIRNQKKMSKPEQLALGTLLHSFMEPLSAFGDSDLEILDTLPEGVNKLIRAYQDTAANYATTPIVRDSLALARAAIAETVETQAPLTEAEIGTPAGNAKIQTQVASANIAPDVGNAENIRITLNHDKAGRITLTPEQRHALNLSRNMIEARLAQEKLAQSSGVTPRDVVGKQVITGDDAKYGDARSALQYVKAIRAALRSGNPEVAQGIMGDFREFVDHMGRKLTATNEYIEGLSKGTQPDYVPYIGWDPVNKKRFRSDTRKKGKGVFINTTNPQQGVEQAFQLGMEQNTLAKIYNALAETFPEMGIEPAEVVSLDPRMTGKASDLVQQIKEGKFGKTTQQSTATPTVTPKAESKPVPTRTEAESQEEGTRAELKKLISKVPSERAQESVQTFIDGELTLNNGNKVSLPEGILKRAVDLVRQIAEGWESYPEQGTFVEQDTWFRGRGRDVPMPAEITDLLEEAVQASEAVRQYGNPMEVTAEEVSGKSFEPAVIKDWTEGRQVIDEVVDMENLCLGTSKHVAWLLQAHGFSAAVGHGSVSVPNSDSEKMDHYVAIVEIDGERFVVDQPQSELFTPTGEGNKVKIRTKTFTPRFIPMSQAAEVYNTPGVSFTLAANVSLKSLPLREFIKETDKNVPAEVVASTPVEAKPVVSKKEPVVGDKPNTPDGSSTDRQTAAAEEAARAEILAEAQAILENKDTYEPVTTEALIKALSMTVGAYIAAVNPEGKQTTDEEADFLAEQVSKLKLPKDAKRLYEKNGIEYFQKANYFYAVVDGEVVGRIATVSTGTTAAVATGFTRKGIATELTKLMIRQNPMTKAGSFSKAGEATRRRAFRELQQELGIAEQVVEPALEPVVEDSPTIKSNTVDSGIKNKGVNRETTLTKRFPGLVSQVKNMFTQLFTEPKESLSRIRDMVSPISELRNYFATEDSVAEFLGGKPKGAMNDDVLAAYSDLLSNDPEILETVKKFLKGGKVSNKELPYLHTAKAIAAVMQRNLQKELNKKYSGNKSTLDTFLSQSGEDGIHRSSRLKHLNLTQMTENGTLVYNQELLEAVVLAGLNWALTQGNTVPKRDSRDKAALLGIQEEDLASVNFSVLNNGLTTTEIVDSLTPMIKQFWGVRDPANDDAVYADNTYLDGIPGSMALEFLRAMVDVGLVEEISVNNTETDQKAYLYRANITDEGLKNNPSLLGQLALKNWQYPNYFGNDIPAVSKYKMNTQGVPNTDKDKAAIKVANTTTYSMDTTAFSMFTGVERDVLHQVFGGGLVTDTMNEVNKETVEGRNTNINAALDAMQALHVELSFEAAYAGQNIEDVGIHYDHNMTTVGRMQQLGGQTPQGNQVVRHIVMSTTAEVDMTNADNQTLFTTAIGQAFGIKIHQKQFSDIAKEVTDKLGKLSPAITMMQDWLKDQTKPFDFLAAKEHFINAGISSGDIAPLTFHALREYVRLQDAKDLKAFKTNLYIEADGVTNGVTMASMLMGIGNFTQAQIENLRKGGITFGSKKTMADLYDGEDMYKKAAITGQQQIIAQEQRTKKNKKANSFQRDILFLAQSLLDGVALETDTAGNISSITFDRGIVKNPMTVTLYGSMPSGISNKLTNMLLERLYEMASEGEISEEIQTAMNNLMGGVLVVPNDPTKNSFVEDSSVQAIDFSDLVKLRLRSSQFTQLRRNILSGLVMPLRTGMESALGNELMHSMTILRRTMQVQSMFFEQGFKKAYDLRIAQRAKSDPSYRKGDGLSNTDVKKIYKDLADIAPWFNTGTQVLLTNKFARLYDANSTAIRSLDESYRAQSSVMAPVNSGVSSLAYLNQSTGDAQMIQRAWASNDPSVRQALPTFDGVQLNLNDIRAASELLNNAVLESGQTNIHRGALASYKAFLKSGFIEAILNEDLPKGFLNDLAWALDIQVEKGKEPDVEELLEGINIVETQLTDMSKQVDARHKAMSTLAASSDQMAAVGSPKLQDGIELDPGVSAAEVATVLNTIYVAEMAKQNNAPIQVSEPIEDLESAVSVVSNEGLVELLNSMDLTQEQKDLLAPILPVLGNTQVIMGDFIDVGQYILDNGLSVALANNGTQVNGTMVIEGNDAKIFLLNQTGETLTHELVHVATIQKILAHYMGQTTDEVTAAVQNIEALMQQFLGLRTTGMTPEGAAALKKAQETVRFYGQQNDPVSKASALNEFMAWSLSNKDIIAKLKKTPLAEYVSKALSAITNLLKSLFGQPKKDMYSNLLFNTGVLINSVPTLNDEISRISLNHDSTVDSVRVSKLINNLQTKIYSYVNDTNVDMGEQLLRTQKQGAAVILGKEIVNDFQNVFDLGTDGAYALELTTAAMALHLDVDSAALTQMQTLYNHVLANLTPESFMPENPVDEQSAYQYSVDKFNLITGKFGRRSDREGRSTLLATFIGLAHVSPDFQRVLRNMPLPKTEKGGTFDQKVSNFAEATLDKVGALVSGQGNSKNVNEAIGRLARKAFDASLQQENLVQKVDGSLNHLIDRGDQILVDRIADVSNAVQRVGLSLGKSGNVAVRALGKTVAVIAQNATEEGASLQADFVVSFANRLKVPAPLSRLISDLIGRTASNAHIIDKIKQLRAVIQQARQHFRNDVPSELVRQFKTPLTERQWEEMFTGVAKTDFVSLMGLVPKADIAKLMDSKFRKDTITSLESLIQREDPANFKAMQAKMKQLATWMNGGPANANLLVNAEAIARLLNQGRKGKAPSAELIQMVDQLTSLYALDGQKKSVLDTLTKLFKDEADGMATVLAYTRETRNDEIKRAHGTNARFNAPKGFIPSEGELGKSLRIVKQSEIGKYRMLGYTELGAYTGSQLDASGERRVYMFTSVPTRASVAQGVMQNIHQSASGVDPRTGLSMGVTGGAIFDKSEVTKINQRILNDRGGAESLRPVFDKKGKVIGYERMLSPTMLTKLNPNKQFHTMLGVWRGRQFEEALALETNQKLVDSTQDEYAKASVAEKQEYVNLMNPASLDPVIKDMINLFSEDIVDYIKDSHSGEFWVRRDLLEDVTGYRQPSVSDFWTGISRWSPETQKGVRDLMISVFGPNIFRRLVQMEQALQGVVGDARTMIIIKSGIVPALNFLSNITHLLTYMPITEIVKTMPKKLTELRQYNKGLARKVQLEVLIRASRDNPAKLSRLRAEMKSIKDSFTRMSIYPLVQAGEYSTVSDVGDSQATLELSQGQLSNWIDSKVDKLPGPVKLPLKYLMVSKDTALFRGLQKSVQYGDFLGKAVLYDHLMKSRKRTREDALGIISDEFVNYDRLPGRWRGGLENFGALWFYNFKLRMVKVAASSLRNRPLRTLLVSQMPVVDGAEMPGTQTIINKIIDDTWHYSVGPGMGLRAPSLNPWANLLN